MGTGNYALFFGVNMLSLVTVQDLINLINLKGTRHELFRNADENMEYLATIADQKIFRQPRVRLWSCTPHGNEIYYTPRDIVLQNNKGIVILCEYNQRLLGIQHDTVGI